MHKQILLTQGKVAIVDAADYEWLTQWKWYAISAANLWYALHKRRSEDGKRINMYMHRLIMDASVGMEVDHINGDGLDNRRDNLRLATRIENSYNRRINKNNRSGFMGVCWDKQVKKWRALVSIDGKQKSIGAYDDPIKAAVARDLAVIEHYGKFANLNFPRSR